MSRTALKGAARAMATIAVLPSLSSFFLRSTLFGRDRAFEGSTQALALLPGLLGQYVRRAFLQRVLPECAPSAVIGFGTVLSHADAIIEANVYVGPHCDLGLVHIERNALIASGVHIPSGPYTHGTTDVSSPIRDQPGQLRIVRIGAGAWIGSNAVVMADVGRHAIVGAGAVVTKPIPDLAFAAGVPARVVHFRETREPLTR